MPNKHMESLVDMSADELDTHLVGLREELFGLRFRNKMRQLDNAIQIRMLRRQIARGEMLRARHAAGAGTPSGGTKAKAAAGTAKKKRAAGRTR